MKRLFRSRAKQREFRLVALVVAGVFACGGLWVGLSAGASYHRPNPVMDYVPQEIGFYDTWYDDLEQTDCRKCHGASLAERHHHTPIVMEQGFCHPCHESTPDPPGVVVIGDCKTSGCHSRDDLLTNGWHHDTDLSGVQNCVVCHDRNLVSDILPFLSFAEYPPSVETPRLFSCQNCHWEQASVTSAVGFDPETSPKSEAGHPSTYDHYDQYGQFSYLEYGRGIASNFNTHHMGFSGYAVYACWSCHSTHPNDPSWDPVDPENIRYCEICHDINTLHTIPGHVEPYSEEGGRAVYGWAAVGFNGSDPNEVPVEYRSFEATEKCRGCHGDNPPVRSPEAFSELPRLDEVNVPSGRSGALVLLSGEHFSSRHTLERGVQLKFKDDPSASWVDVPVRSWSNVEIEWELPFWTFSPGNYLIRVYTEFGGSNQLVFTVEDDAPVFVQAGPDSGTCGTWISLSGSGGFGDQQSKIYGDGYHGVYHVVDFESPTGTYTAKQYENWSDTRLDVRVQKMFFDESDACTGQRNFVQDDASPVPCVADGLPDSPPCDNDCAEYRCFQEPDFNGCESMDIGPYSIYVRAIYFGDEDKSGGLSCGDNIFQVFTSGAMLFELEPYIQSVTPKDVQRGDLFTITGKGFGGEQLGGSVHIGTRRMAKSQYLNKGWVLTGIDAWNDAQITVWLDVLPKWENRTKYVWVERDGMKSNFKRIAISEPDGDGIFGDADNCPDIANVSQLDGDGDGLGDLCDCWGDPGQDADNDGVCVDVDNCPAVMNADQKDADGDGIGNACDVCPYDSENDLDGDGVCGNADNCPDTANPDLADADGDGQGDACDVCPDDLDNDADGDGVCGDVDNCPEIYNKGQRDSDRDGVGDKCDACPYDPADDADGDGVCGDLDNCPEIANAEQADFDADGIGDLCDACPDDSANDIDGDGLCGTADNCPEIYNSGQRDSDRDGVGNKCDVCPYDGDNDGDSDGVCGDIDNCPEDANPDQADFDVDGIGDICDICPYDRENDGDSDGLCGDIDNCPDTANPDQADVDNDGIGDLCDACPGDSSNDGDGDGLCGDVDNCPDTPNADQADADDDGQGDACDVCPNDADNDVDGDGVCGDIDNCPEIANADQADSNGNGIGDACEPVADARADLQFVSADQAVTVIQGVASDPNGDALTFRWLEGENALCDWQAVGALGEAYLDLSTLPSFSPGDHVLTLQVNDGSFVSSDYMVVTVLPDAVVQLISAHVSGGGGGTGIHFYVGDTVTFHIDFEITGGDPEAQYEVAGIAVPQYPYCTNDQRRARSVEIVGMGVHSISFQKNVPPCATDPLFGPSGWTDVEWRVDLRDEDGIILRDRDRLTTNEALAIDG